MINVSQVTQKLIDEEGEVLHAYTDSEGYLTIGVGHLIDERKGGCISQKISRLLLADDIMEKTQQCVEQFDWFLALDEVRRGVIVCMAFQLGARKVAGFKLMIRAIKNRDWVAAHLEMMDSDWHKQTPKRCERMAKIMLKGVWQ